MAPKVLSYRRAVLILAGIITLYLILHNTHNRPSSADSFRTPTEHHPAGQPHDREAGINPPPIPKHAYTTAPASRHKDRNQAPLTELAFKPLRSQLTYYFPYEPHLKFPAYIWQTWKVSPADSRFPEAWRPLEASWTELHPGFTHEVITDDSAVFMLRHLYSAIPDVVEAYTSLPQPVLKADFFRYLILLARGGIYTDMDTAAIRSAIEWIPAKVPREAYGLVIGIEADPDRDDWATWYSRRIQFSQWTIQAKPGHPVLREIVARITEETLGRKRSGTLTKYDQRNVVDLTGPAIWTDTVFGYFNDPHYFAVANESVAGAEVGEGVEAQDTGVGRGSGIGTDQVDGPVLQNNNTISWRNFTGIRTQKLLGDVVVLPITSFSPGVGQMGAGGDDDEMAFVKHLFEGMLSCEQHSSHY